MCKEQEQISLKSVSDFISDTTDTDMRDRHFFIPSYQRGYRWEPQDVTCLLDDIFEFIEEGKNPNKKKRPYYCLQPIVVKKKDWKDFGTNIEIEGWEVIDGQQRLTTLYLILSVLKKKFDNYQNKILYDITYETRPGLNIKNIDIIDPELDIDSFYIKQAVDTINKWIEDTDNKYTDNKDTQCQFEDLAKCLFGENGLRDVRFIWYEDETNDKADSIKTFNNLNKGKIRLTSSELIKACFLLHYAKDKSMCKEIASEWYRMETALQDKHFWKFLTNNSYNPGTHIDLIFDFMVHKENQDADYVYHKFNRLFEGKETIMGYDVNTIWEEVKRVFDMFVYWYQNRETYHYIGYLVTIGESLPEIYEETKTLRKDKMIETLVEMIKNKVNVDKKGVRELKYGNGKVYKLLLLFNIATMVKMKENRFDFAAFKEENKFDVEHIASQTTNPLQSREDRIKWLEYLEDLEKYVPTEKKEEWNMIRLKAKNLIGKMKGNESIENKAFEDVSKKTIEIIESGSIEDEDKDRIWNLTLLDSHTNRSYGNALFPTKCKEIIEREEDGTFIPPVTKNVFLKYYSKKKNDIHQWDQIWNEQDAQNYENEMIETIKNFLKA